jgi:two-component SAPR family response regulator
MLLMETAMVHAAMGSVELAKTSYQQALKILQAEKNLYLQADTLNNLAFLYHQLGEYELATETYESGVECARSSLNQRAEALILTGLGDLYSEIEEFEAAGQAYEQAESISAGLSGFFIANYLVLARANMALLQENPDAALEILRSFQKHLKVNPSTYERGLWSLHQGRTHLLKNETKKAISFLKDGKDCFTQDGRESETLWCLVWLMAAYEQAGQRENARLQYRELMAMRNRSTHALLITLYQASAWLKELQTDPEMGRNLSGLLERALQLGEQIISIRRVLRRHAQSIQLPAATLVIRAFGRAEVSVNGRVIPMSEWRTKSVRDLFFYFLFRQDALTKEQIGEALWPETMDPQALKARFKDEIYRLRRAVGRNVIVFDEVYYRFNRTLDYEYDVEAFESYLSRARRARDSSRRIEWYQKAVDLFQGPYLNESDSPWVHDERQRLGQVYESALEELAGLYLDTNQLERCLSISQIALSQNRYNEGVYQLQMRAYAALGERASIVRCYQACKALLHEGLGISPSPETETLYQDLIA